MKKYLALDTGGTKVQAILYNEKFEPLRIARTGSLRDNTTSAELIERNLSDIVEKLELKKGDVLERVSGTMEGSLHRRIAGICEIKRFAGLGELEAGLHAAVIFGDGLLTLSGTGATVFAKYDGNSYCGGGYGAAVSDAGGGYWMGREAMNAAIADYEERGEPTLLTELVCRHFARPTLPEAIFSIYGQNAKSPAACVASCAPLVTIAAETGDGDPVALDLLRRTGKILGEQMVSLIKRNSLPDSLPLTISGSVWRGHRLIFDSFVDVIRNQCPSRRIVIPPFEPIIGIILHHWLEEYGNFDDIGRERFNSLYGDFTFDIHKPKIYK